MTEAFAALRLQRYNFFLRYTNISDEMFDKSEVFVRNGEILGNYSGFSNSSNCGKNAN